MNDTKTIEIYTDKPQELMRRATDVAGVCKEIVLKTAVQIQGRKYVRCEGWMSIATAHGCIASSKDVEKVEGGWRAIGEIRRISDGVALATAEGFVGLDETKTWAVRPEYACRAMAQTRAISRACRAAFSHVVVMMDAGLSTTPAEEVPDDGFDDHRTARTAPPATMTPKFIKNVTTRPTERNSPAPVAVKVATAVTLNAMIEWFLANGATEQDILGYAIDKSVLLPTEDLTDWPLDKVPTSKAAWQTLLAQIKQWRDGDLVPADPPPAAPESQPDEGEDPPCFSVIVPVPHKGEKRDAYLKNPDTIGSLYHAMKNGDGDSQSRLFGFAKFYEPKPWTKRDGTEMPPSDTDVKFRTALDEFLAWHDEHPGEVTP